MSNASKRKALFHHFSKHLNLLKANGYLKGTTLKFENTFICPICLQQFSEKDLDASSPNMLTLEHAPPETLMGEGVALTCKNCNSKTGHEIDFHLTERLLEADRRAMLPQSNARVKVTNGALTVQANIHVDTSGVIEMTHSERNNHPTNLINFIDAVNPTTNSLIYINFGDPRTKYFRLEIALLKTAYILAFAKYGYSFILSNDFNIVRQQILNPDSIIYPHGFYTNKSFLKTEHEGVNICSTPTAESIYCIFPLVTSAKVRRYGVHLPIPLLPAKFMISNLHYLANREGELSFDIENTSEDYLFDLENINSLWNWFIRVRLSKINNSDRMNIPTAVKYLASPLNKWEYSYFSYPPKRIRDWPPRLARK